YTSLCHWTTRPDFNPEKRAVGHWHIACVNSLLGRGQAALELARLALEAARDVNAITATALAADMPPAATDTISAGSRSDPPPRPRDDAEPAYLLGYAHEAMARASALLGDDERAEFHRAEAWLLADEVVDDASRERLLADLASLREGREPA